MELLGDPGYTATLICVLQLLGDAFCWHPVYRWFQFVAVRAQVIVQLRFPSKQPSFIVRLIDIIQLPVLSFKNLKLHKTKAVKNIFIPSWMILTDMSLQFNQKPVLGQQLLTLKYDKVTWYCSAETFWQLSIDLSMNVQNQILGIYAVNQGCMHALVNILAKVWPPCWTG